MTESVAEMFSSLIPSVSSTEAADFATGMCAYHTAFKNFRDRAMNYETLPDYVNTQYTVMEVPKDRLWIYTPHFRKCVSLTIQQLFGTKIVSFATNPISVEQGLIFVDEHSNRWIMSVSESPHNPELNLICVYYPRSNTPICTYSIDAPLKALTDPEMFAGGASLIVVSAVRWNDAPSI